jgi:hypothetical protein
MQLGAALLQLLRVVVVIAVFIIAAIVMVSGTGGLELRCCG